MSTLETNAIGKYSGNNVSVDDALNLKSYDTAGRDALTSVAGDTIYNSDDNKVQVYTGSAWEDLGGIAAFSLEYLVVGGGGNPRLTSGVKSGGGGAGGQLTNVSGDNSGGGNSASPAFYVVPGTNYDVEVGASKGISYFESITSGAGGSSGSGGFSTNGAATTCGGTGTTAPTNPYPNQGFQGGAGNLSGQSVGGGGGGTGTVGGDNPGATGGNGGTGTISTIISASDATTYSVGEVSGSDVYFGGGGGGAGTSAGGGTSTGGLGGGGNGKSDSSAAEFGAANTGGGGGASNTGTDGQGGSGVVILKFPDTYTITVGAGLTDATSGGITSGGFTTVILTAGVDTVSWS